MNPIHFFKNHSIIRGRDIRFTYAMGQELENSIAYVQDSKALGTINKIPQVSMVITNDQFVEKVCGTKGVIVSDNPQRDFFLFHNFMIKENHISPLNENYIDDSAVIAPTARIGNNVRIGRNVTIDDFCIIESNTAIGDDCEIGSFVVIGAKSMQRTMVDGQLLHLEYAGGVKIGNRSRVLTGAIIQKPYQAFYTQIGDDSVISTKVIVGHGSRIGNRTLLSGGSGVAGNCILGNDVWIGAGAMVSDSVKVGYKAKVLLGSIVIRSEEHTSELQSRPHLVCRLL